MPRSFMITNRRYRTEVEYVDSKDCSPEPPDMYLTASYDCSVPDKITPSDVKFDFYNNFHGLSGLEQLAEISLATAHRWNPSPPSSPETAASSDVSSYSDSSLSSTSGHSSPADFRRHHHRRHHHHHRTKVTRQCSPTHHHHHHHHTPDSTEDQPLALVNKIKSCEDEEEGNVDTGKKDESGDGKSPLATSNTCPECGKRYSTSSNLARHRQTHRSMEDKKARKCPHCDKVYVSMPAYSMHVRTHNQGCQCPFCGKCYSRPWLLQGHIRTHTGEKPFKCQVCNKAFADKSNLRAHVQTHSDTKPFVCQRCGKAFALKSYLYKHEESSCMRAQATSVPRLLASPDAHKRFD